MRRDGAPRRQTLIFIIFLTFLAVHACAPRADDFLGRRPPKGQIEKLTRRTTASMNSVETGRPIPYGHGVRGEQVRPANPAYDRTAPGEDPYFDRRLPSASDGTYTHEPAQTFNVALILPLSGDYAMLGRQMLQAAQLALFNLKDPAVNIMPYDDKSDPVTGAQAFREAQKHDVDAVLGPLFRPVADAVSDAARGSGVPIVSFSNDTGVTAKGAYAFGMLPQTQYERMANFALSQRIRDFSLLAPNNAYGGAALGATRRALQGRPDVAFSRIELYRDDQYVTPEALRDHIEAALAPLLKGNAAYSALILPETSPRLLEIVRIARELPDFSQKVQIVGDAAWTQNPEIMHAPQLADAWIAMPPQDRQLLFERRFTGAYRQPPGKLASLAYDGVNMLSAIAHRNGGKIIRDADLQRREGFDGILGSYRFSPDRAVRRDMAVYRIDNTGNVILLDAPRGDF
ncbi:MAG: penicillin-binding protein activator [Rickettsiales bacterium]